MEGKKHGSSHELDNISPGKPKKSKMDKPEKAIDDVLK
jgi:hypothetical protein